MIDAVRTRAMRSRVTEVALSGAAAWMNQKLRSKCGGIFYK